MSDPFADLAGLLGRCPADLASLLRRASSSADRAAALAALLADWLPEARLTACLLGEGGPFALRPDPPPLDADRQAELRSRLSSLPPLSSEVHTLAAAPGLSVLAAAVHDGERGRGFLAAGLPDAAADALGRARVLLAVCAPAAAVLWSLESVRGEQAELARFALLGQAFAGLAHDLNNALNSMMLQTSVVQLRVDESVRHDLAAIRQHGASAAGLVRSLQHVVQERREQSYAVDLGAALAELLDDEPSLRPRLIWRRGGEGLTIKSTRSAVRQFLRLLLAGACRGSQSAVELAAEKHPDGAALTLTLAGGDGDPPTVETVLWQNLDDVSRLAGQSLLRQLGGALTVESAGEGKVVLRVLWGTEG